MSSPFSRGFPYLSTSHWVFPLSTLYKTVCPRQEGLGGGKEGEEEGRRAGAGVILWWQRSGGRFYPACLEAVTRTVYTLPLYLLITPCPPSLKCSVFFLLFFTVTLLKIKISNLLLTCTWICFQEHTKRHVPFQAFISTLMCPFLSPLPYLPARACTPSSLSLYLSLTHELYQPAEHDGLLFFFFLKMEQWMDKKTAKG